MNEIIKKIDDRIATYKEKQKLSDYGGKIAYQNIINGINEAKEIIQSEQKEPCGYCKGLNNNYTEIKMKNYEIEWAHTFGKINYCPMCGRQLNQKAEED